MRIIDYIVLHATMSNSTATARQINDWFLRSKRQKGWGLKVGRFHYIVDQLGTIEEVYSIDVVCQSIKAFAVSAAANRIAIQNSNSVHLAYIGGVDVSDMPFNNMSVAQGATLAAQVHALLEAYPSAKVLGANQIQDGIDSPNFWVPDWALSVGIGWQNIHGVDHFFWRNRDRRIDQFPYGDLVLQSKRKRFIAWIELVGGEPYEVVHSLGISDATDLIMDCWLDVDGLYERVFVAAEILSTDRLVLYPDSSGRVKLCLIALS